MINKIIGIGDGGSQIAEHFKKYYDYSVLSASEKGDIKIPTAKKVEDLEDKMFSTKKKWSKTLKAFAGDDDLLFIVNGAAKSSAISLVLMEEVKENPKTVIFVKSISARTSVPCSTRRTIRWKPPVSQRSAHLTSRTAKKSCFIRLTSRGRRAILMY